MKQNQKNLMINNIFLYMFSGTIFPFYFSEKSFKPMEERNWERNKYEN